MLPALRLRARFAVCRPRGPAEPQKKKRAEEEKNATLPVRVSRRARLTRVAVVARPQSLPPLMRSPSWPPMKIEVTDELKNVQRPKKMRKAIMVASLIIINDILIFIAASLLLREYLQINTKEAFGPGLTVSGHLTSDSLEVTVDEPQNAIFRSQSSDSAVSVRAAAYRTAKLVLGKTSSPDWGIANNPQDQLLISKGERSFLMMDGVTTTSTISTHVDTEDNTLFGAPLIMSTGGPIPSHACTVDADCGAGQCSGSGVCHSGVVAEDILLAPGSGGTIRLNAPVEPVKGDLVFKPEERIVVRKQTGAVGGEAAQFLLENTHLKLLNPSAATCVTGCLGSGTAAQQAACTAACAGVNSLKTLNAEEAANDPYGHEGSLSLSDKMYLHPGNTEPAFGTTYAGRAVGPPSVSLAGAMDLGEHQLIGEPLYLTAKSGTNITMEALNDGHIVMHSPLKMVGPIIPRDLEYLESGDPSSGGGVPMVQVMGTVKVQNLQFKLLDTEMDRPDASPQPGECKTKRREVT
jgi:hypothetical protein